jgi:hypothetical protein
MKNYNDEVKRLEGVWAVRWATGSFYSKHMTSKASILNQWIRGLLWVGAPFAFGLPMHASGLETLFHISTGRPGPMLAKFAIWTLKHDTLQVILNLSAEHIFQQHFRLWFAQLRLSSFNCEWYVVSAGGLVTTDPLCTQSQHFRSNYTSNLI